METDGVAPQLLCIKGMMMVKVEIDKLVYKNIRQGLEITNHGK
jgi:hypothetical protein